MKRVVQICFMLALCLGIATLAAAKTIDDPGPCTFEVIEDPLCIPGEYECPPPTYHTLMTCQDQTISIPGTVYAWDTTLYGEKIYLLRYANPDYGYWETHLDIYRIRTLNLLRTKKFPFETRAEIRENNLIAIRNYNSILAEVFVYNITEEKRKEVKPLPISLPERKQ